MSPPFFFLSGVRLRAPTNGGSSHQLWLRHPTSPLPLLPSGPDGIHDWSSRRNQCGPPYFRPRRAPSRDAPRAAPRRRWRRGWDSNPRTPVKMLLEFQSSAFDRSATSPINCLQRISLNNLRRSRPLSKGRRMIMHAARRRTRAAHPRCSHACGGFATLKGGG